jgi:gluconate 5-dehydrogenase
MHDVKLPGIKLFEMKGKNALITGGSKGLGYAMGAALASAGANVFLISRNLDEGRVAANKLIADFGVHAKAYAVDVTQLPQIEAVVEQIISGFGRIDVLINSAGINIRGAIEELSPEDFKEVMRINVEGTWNACRAVTPHMKQHKSGKIINLASTLGLVGLANRTPYATSKGAVVQLTRALGLELAPYNINVNAICPGPFLTEMNVPIAHTAEAMQFIVGATALARWGELKEIQGAALFLASDAASYMVGSMLTVDGGWTAK